MKIDLVGKEKRGLALGFNEFAGYLSVALVGFATGYMASIYGLKPYPFYIGIAFVALGTLLSLIIVRDTMQFMLLETQKIKCQLTRNPPLQKAPIKGGSLSGKCLPRLRGKTERCYR